MQRSPFRRIAAACAAATILLAMAAGAASAHTQTVTPPGLDEAVRDGVGISRGFAQAHCQAASPGVLPTTSSVVSFSPAEPKPCTTDQNPGGQDPAANAGQ